LTGERPEEVIAMARAAGADGPRRRLDRPRIVCAAMDLADERGIEAVTMRELGRKLGVEAASLYNHVAGRGDVLDGMVDVVVAQIDVPSGGVHWREAMRRRAVSARSVFSRHPWAGALIDSSERSGSSSLSYVDRVLGALLGAGFSPTVAANAFLALDSYIFGFERQRANLSMEDDAGSGEKAQETLAAIPQGAYPSLTRVAMQYAAEPFDEDAAFDFGLEMILDGLERILGRA
jgi:AcrR family transcriptional regulator